MKRPGPATRRYRRLSRLSADSPGEVTGRSVFTSDRVVAISTGTHSGRCVQGSTPAVSRSASGTGTSSASELVTWAQVCSRPPRVVIPTGPVVFTPPDQRSSTPWISQSARSRTSTSAIGCSRCSGTTTRPPRAILRSHQPSRSTGSYGPQMSPARASSTEPRTAVDSVRSAAALIGP